MAGMASRPRHHERRCSMRTAIEVVVIAAVCVAVSAFMGASESAGLFGAIIGVGIYAAKKGQP